MLGLAKISSIEYLENDVEPPASAVALVGELKILIPLAGLIDKDAELARLHKEIGKIEKELEKCHAKLSNENYISKAPLKWLH